LATEKQIRELKRRHAPQLLARPGVCGVGVEKNDSGGGYVLAVHVDTDDPEALKQLPEEIEGHSVKYIHSGPFRKFTAG
jgi:hypothetical protein